MILGAIGGLFLLIALPIAISEGKWEVAATAAVVGLLIVGLACCGSKVNRAYGNFIDYWADGKLPEQRKRAYRPRRDSRLHDWYQARIGRKKRQAYIKSVQERSRANRG